MVPLPGRRTFDEWLLARMTAQDAPDIYWANTEDLWPHVNKGWALDFTEYMNQPNPYVDGNEEWKDQFEEIAIISQTGPDGKLYGVNMDGAGVLTVYNKDAFAEAGIDKEPKTWAEFKAAWQKLLDKGYIAYGADLSTDTCCFPHWFDGQSYTQLLWDDVWKWDDDKNKVITGQGAGRPLPEGRLPGLGRLPGDGAPVEGDGALLPGRLRRPGGLPPALPPGQGGHVHGRQLGDQRVQGLAAALRDRLAALPHHHQGHLAEVPGEDRPHPGRVGRHAVSRPRLHGPEGRRTRSR